MRDKMREALQEILRVHANDNHRPKAFYIAAEALAEQPAQGEAVAESTRTAPERIWLCLSDEEGDESMPFPRGTGEVTWAEDAVVHVTVEYLRADLTAPPAPAVPELLEACKRLLASSMDYTEWQERGMVLPPPDLLWSKEIEDHARATIAKATGTNQP